MDMNENNDIEKLAREAFRHDEQQPPAEVWEQLSRRMAAEGLTSGSQASRPFLRRAGGRWLIASVAVAAIATTLLVAHPDDTPVAQEALPVAEEPTTEMVAEEPTEIAEEKASESLPAPAVAAPVRSTSEIADVDEVPAAATESATSATLTPAVSVQPEPVAPAAPQPAAAPAPQKAAAPVHAENTPQTPAPASKTPSVDPGQPVVPPVDTVTPRESILTRIPNVITPNNDGINDCWVLRDVSEYGPLQVQIFTAQSKRVFMSDDYRNDFCGDDLPDGNYFYVLTLKSRNIVRRGVLVIRR